MSCRRLTFLECHHCGQQVTNAYLRNQAAVTTVVAKAQFSTHRLEDLIAFLTPSLGHQTLQTTALSLEELKNSQSYPTVRQSFLLEPLSPANPLCKPISWNAHRVLKCSAVVWHKLFSTPPLHIPASFSYFVSGQRMASRVSHALSGCVHDGSPLFKT